MAVLHGALRLHWRSQPLTVPQRRRCTTVHVMGSHVPDNKETNSRQPPSHALRLLACIAVIEIAQSSSTKSAHAWNHVWRPRRHHRRLGEMERSPDLGKYSPENVRRKQRIRDRDAAKSKGEKKEDDSLWAQFGSIGKAFRGKLEDQQQKVEAHRKEQEWQSVGGVGRTRPTFSPVTSIALLVVLVLFGRWLFGVIQTFSWGGGMHRKGRYVRDRSMGGKMVFVPDATPGPPKQIGNTSTGSGIAPVSVSGRRASADPWQTASPRETQTEELPAWWSPTHQIYIDPAYKQEAQQEAQALVNRMLNAKVAGHDYELSNFVGLRALCGESGVTVDAKAQRDSLFRAAAEMAATSSEEQTNRLGGQTPGKFLSGLAQDLGIPQKDAINMVNAVVAKRSRQILITACASYREEKNNEVLMELLKLASLTTALPLPEHSAQTEMVAAGIQQSATLPERQAIFLTYGCMDQAGASQIAEMLGFQPGLVLPQLQKHIVEGSKASQSSQEN